MKIGIITQPLAINYGGLLQNYALQKVLVSLGHEVYTINRSDAPDIYTASYYKKIRFFINQSIKRILNKPSYLLYKEYIRIRQACISFVQRNITVTDIFKTQEDIYDIINKYDFNGYVVGSDQVWRPCYSLSIYNDFLDFCQDKTNIKRIAYAASFGVNQWEFNEEQTTICRRLLNMFDAVSVRESSGVELCEKYFGITAMHVLDPTLLLEKEDYIKLVEQEKENISSGNLFCYILDNKKSIDNAISDIEHKMLLKAFQVKADKSNYEYKKGENIKDYIIPSPTKWLRAFMDAKMVFTDSFHGCVFSIIFNKPFWVIGNRKRGNARFESLLKIFNIEDRCITLDEIDHVDLNARIDWNRVNSIRMEWKKKSIDFLKENL